MYDQPTENPFFSHSDISTLNDAIAPNVRREVIVMGDHELSGQRGVICGVGEYIRGIGTYQVELGPQKRRVWIPGANLAPLCVIHVCLDGSIAQVSLRILPQIGSDLGIRLGDYKGQTGQVMSFDKKNVTLRISPTMEASGGQPVEVSIS